MAQVQMQVYRGTSDYLDTISNVDGQFLYDEDTHQILLDNGTTREQYGGGNEKVYDTYAEAVADLANIAEGQTVFVKEGSNDDLAQRVDDLATDLGDKSTASAVSGADAFAKINTLNTQLTVADISTQLVPDVPVKTVVFKSMRRMGKLVEIDFNIVLNQALTHGNAIFGGVPKPASNTNSRFTFTATTSGVRTPIEFSWNIGYLGAFYPQSGITGTDSVITGHLMYITE